MKIEQEVLERQIVERMSIDNPWWTTEQIPADIHQMKRRLYLDSFYKAVKETGVRRGIVLMGPRRVGKTILIYHTIERLIADGVPPQSIIYLSIDTPIYNGKSLEMLLKIALKSLAKSITDETFYVFYDEVQYLKDWELHLKSLVDTYRSTRFIVSGSAAAALKMKSNESGAGRFHDFALPPLTFNEYIHLQELGGLIVPQKIRWNHQEINAFDTIDLPKLNEHFIRYINYGGYPEVVFSKEIQQDPGRYMRRDIVDKVMLKDLPGLYGISDTQELYRLFIHIAYRSGCEFSYEEMSQESGIRKETIRKYIGYLESAYLIKVVHRIDANAKRMQRITQFKIYLTNPSLRCALFSPLTEMDKSMGSMVETALFAQRLQRDDEEVFYANWKMGRENGEVDMVGLDRRNQKPSWAVEMKWSDRYYDAPGELKSLLSFMDRNHLLAAIVSSRTKYGTKDLENVSLTFIPSSLYAYLLGYNTIEQRRA
jgi:hypothetical protein